jgi:hypothetical protein
MDWSKIEQYLIPGLFALTFTYVGVYAGKNYFPKHIYHTTEVVNDSLWVSKSVYLSEKQAKERLFAENSDIITELNRTKARLDQVTRLNATLRTQKDTVEVEKVVYIDRTIPVDTTFTTFFGDRLFAADANVTVKDDTLRLTQDLRQLRPVRIELVTATNDEGTLVYVRSADFETVDVESFVAYKKPKYKWFHYFGAGILSGVVVWELIR